MGKTARTAAIVVAVLLLILFSLPFLIHLNRFRPTIVAQMSQALGRQVKIGDLKLSLMPAGVSATDLAIADDPAFSANPFLTAKSARIGVDLRRLIRTRKLYVTGVVIESPRIALWQSASGDWNFSKLLAFATGAVPAGITVKRVDIEGGVASVGGAYSKSSPLLLKNVDVEMRDFSLASVMPFTLSASVAGGGQVKAYGTAGPLNPLDLIKTPVNLKLDIADLDLTGSGCVEPSSGFAGVVAIDGSAGSDGQGLQVTGRLKADRLKVARNGSTVSRPVQIDFAMRHDLQTRVGTLTRGDVHIGGLAASLAGTYAMSAGPTAWNMNLRAPNMPVPEFAAVLPAFGVVLPAGSSFRGGAAGVRLWTQGPTNRLISTGDLGIKNTRLTGYDLVSKISPLAGYTGVPTGPDTYFESITTGLRISPEGLETDHIQIVAPSIGVIQGAGTVSVNHALNYQMRTTVRSAGGLMSVLNQSGTTTIPFSITGTSSAPIFQADMNAVATERSRTIQNMGSDAARKASDILGGLLNTIQGK